MYVYNREYFLAAVLVSPNIQNICNKLKEMALKNYAVIMPTEKSSIEINSKLNSLQRNDIAKNYIIYTKWFSACTNIISKN
jgi:hypothetical protein